MASNTPSTRTSTRQGGNNKQRLSNAGTIVFTEHDDQRNAMDSLRIALARGGVPALSLVLKVKESEEGNDEIVNWMFADEEFIRSLALVLPNKQ